MTISDPILKLNRFFFFVLDRSHNDPNNVKHISCQWVVVLILFFMSQATALCLRPSDPDLRCLAVFRKACDTSCGNCLHAELFLTSPTGGRNSSLEVSWARCPAVASWVRYSEENFFR